MQYPWYVHAFRCGLSEIAEAAHTVLHQSVMITLKLSKMPVVIVAIEKGVVGNTTPTMGLACKLSGESNSALFVDARPQKNFNSLRRDFVKEGA